MTDLLLSRSAIISPCGLYRQRLDREIADSGAVAAIIGVNPSTADGEKDDATIRKDMGFARRLGWRRIIKANKFAYRARDIAALRALDMETAVGPDTDDYLRAIMAEADIVIAAWGPLLKLPPHLRHRWRRVTLLAERAQKPLHAFGVAQDGQPRHTLMIPYSTELVRWRAPE